MKRDIEEGLINQADSLGTADEFRRFLRVQAREALCRLIENEVRVLCGESYHPGEEAGCYRAGSAPSSVYVNGERQELKRPRVRRRKDQKSEEVSLKIWKLARDPEEWEQAMMPAVLCRVSNRDGSRLRGRTERRFTIIGRQTLVGTLR